MTVSDWGAWLPREIESTSPDGVSIWYLGCNGVALKAREGTTIFIDPYLGLGDPPRTVRMIPVPFDPEDVASADALFVTHEHSDHAHGETQAPILERTGATLFAPDASIDVASEEAWVDRWSIDDEQLTAVEAGDVLEIGAFTVHVESAHDPDAIDPVSYVVEHETGTFFHGGDARPSADFEEIGLNYDIDVGVLAFGSVGVIPDKRTGESKRTRWYSDENAIIEATNQLRLDRLVPTHWDMWKGLTADPTVLHHHARSFEYPTHVDVVEIGDRIEL